MPWRPTLLEDSLDPWLSIEPDPARRRSVLEFMVQLCEAGGRIETAIDVSGTRLPAYAAAVPGQNVVVVWVVAAAYQELAFRYLYDVDRSQYFGG